jgi:hypothetical protein
MLLLLPLLLLMLRIQTAQLPALLLRKQAAA